ncbi:MAG: bile acid:sodium symporter [Thermodesulfobacteriota bacterium]
MPANSAGLIGTVEDFTRRNLLLLLIICAIGLAVYLPAPEAVLDTSWVNAILVAAIFISQGLKMDLSQAHKAKSYLKLVGVAALVAIVAYPALAWVVVKLFGLSSDHKVGFLLMASFPNSLEAAMAMSASAGGDPLTAVILLTALNIIGLVSIPLNLSIWLGAESPVSEWQVLQNMVFYLFAPIITGQILRKLFPKLPSRMTNINHYLPMICITGLVYLSCSKEADLLRELRLHDLFQVVAPSVLLHVVMFGLAFVAARHWLKLEDRSGRSFMLITSEKPMSLSVAIWAVTYAEHHPLAIFPIVVFYVSQIVIDSFIVSKMVARDNSALNVDPK